MPLEKILAPWFHGINLTYFSDHDKNHIHCPACKLNRRQNGHYHIQCLSCGYLKKDYSNSQRVRPKLQGFVSLYDFKKRSCTYLSIFVVPHSQHLWQTKSNKDGIINTCWTSHQIKFLPDWKRLETKSFESVSRGRHTYLWFLRLYKYPLS